MLFAKRKGVAADFLPQHLIFPMRLQLLFNNILEIPVDTSGDGSIV